MENPSIVRDGPCLLWPQTWGRVAGSLSLSSLRKAINSDQQRAVKEASPTSPAATSPDAPSSPYPGGIGEAVSSALVGEPGITVSRLAVGEVPRSGKPSELLKMFGIDRDAIAQAVRDLVAKA